MGGAADVPKLGEDVAAFGVHGGSDFFPATDMLGSVHAGDVVVVASLKMNGQFHYLKCIELDDGLTRREIWVASEMIRPPSDARWV